MARLNLGQIKTAANVRTEDVVKMLQRKAAAVPNDKIRVGVGFSAAYAMFLHEKKEMKWKGLPRGGASIKKRTKGMEQSELDWYRENFKNLRADIKYLKKRKQTADTAHRHEREVSHIRQQMLEAKEMGILRRSKRKGFYWDPQDRAQPNFLVGPFREMHGDFVKIIQREMKKTGNIELALLTAGARLQREAQQRVPVEFGFLKASAWTRRLS